MGIIFFKINVYDIYKEKLKKPISQLFYINNDIYMLYGNFCKYNNFLFKYNKIINLIK